MKKIIKQVIISKRKRLKKSELVTQWSEPSEVMQHTPVNKIHPAKPGLKPYLQQAK